MHRREMLRKEEEFRHEREVARQQEHRALSELYAAGDEIHQLERRIESLEADLAAFRALAKRASALVATLDADGSPVYGVMRDLAEMCREEKADADTS